MSRPIRKKVVKRSVPIWRIPWVGPVNPRLRAAMHEADTVRVLQRVVSQVVQEEKQDEERTMTILQ